MILGREGALGHLRNLRTSGTVLPSSGFLVGSLLRGVDFTRATRVVELGVGTGCVTREVLRRLRSDARLVSLEVNPAFVAACRAIRDPRLTVVEACASRLPQVLAEQGLEAVDAVVSSLPLSLMPDALVERILDGSRDSLAPDGRFVQYQYSLSHHERLHRRYDLVNVAFTLLNVPPAFVYCCGGDAAGEATGMGGRPSLASAYAAALAMVGSTVWHRRGR